MSEASSRLRAAIRELRRTRNRDGTEKTADDIAADQLEYDAAMRFAKEYAATHPSVTSWGEQGWHPFDPDQ